MRTPGGGKPPGLPIVIGVLLALALNGCASSGVVYTPQPFPMPGGTTATPAPAPAPSTPGRPAPRTGSADGYSLSSTALSLRGAPYRNGGIDPKGFDCSGFVKYVFNQNGVNVPREVRDQFRMGKGVDRNRLHPGDLVFFTTVAPGASHVGIAIGGDQFVHAPSERGVVRVEQLSTQYWASRFVGAKRVN
ncbi:MAG: C40 family peptidase [Vicinamibacterales bacterium]